MDLIDLYFSYIESKKNLVRPGTYKNDYLVTLHHLQKCPWTRVNIDTENGYNQKIYDWGCQYLSKGSCKRLLMQLNASFKWAIKRKIISLSKSPFEGMANELKIFIRTDDADINPFSKQERDLIIQCFKIHSNPSVSHYYNYVQFLFFTGCRPSEAIALKWVDIKSNLSEINFRSVIVGGVGGRYHCQGLKSQSHRTFPCNSQVREILRNCPKTSEFVFSSIKGKRIDLGYFRRIWICVLRELEIEYRKPYQCRHTFITLCLEAGVEVKDVARLVGNKPEIIYKFYAGRRVNLEVPLL
jgi:integrase